MPDIDLINRYHVRFHIKREREPGWITGDEHIEGVIEKYDHGVYTVRANDGRIFEITSCEIFQTW